MHGPNREVFSMALKSNVFTSDHQAFLEKLANLGHFQQLVAWALGFAKDTFTRSLDAAEKHGIREYWGAARCLSICNVFHDGEYALWAPYGKRTALGEQLFPMAEEMERRFNSFLFVWTFEAVEQPLQRLYGKLLFQLRGEVAVANKKDFHRSQPAWTKQEGTPQYFAAYAKFAWRRSYRNVLEQFEKHVDWDRVKVGTTYHDMAWRTYIEAIEFCRHRIVHNEGRVSPDSMKELGKGQQAYVKSCLHKSLYSTEQHLLPPEEIIEGLFKAVATYGWALYVLLSEHCSMPDESQIFKARRANGRPVRRKKPEQ